MSAFSGKQSAEPKHGRRNKGVMRTHKEVLREEAEARNAATPPERRRAFRLAQEKSQ